MVAFDGFVYAIGGVSNENVLNTVERYRIDLDEWVPEKAMIQPRSAAAAAAAVMKNQIFVLGGATKYNTAETATVERFDGLSWTNVNYTK